MADLDIIQALVEDMNQKMGNLCVSVGKINERCEAREKILHGHTITLFGEDGTSGVVARQNRILQQFESSINLEKNKQQWKQKIFSPVISAIIVAIITGLFWLYVTVKYGNQHSSSELRGRPNTTINRPIEGN
jgi:hypothetical protein